MEIMFNAQWIEIERVRHPNLHVTICQNALVIVLYCRQFKAGRSDLNLPTLAQTLPAASLAVIKCFIVLYISSPTPLAPLRSKYVSTPNL